MADGGDHDRFVVQLPPNADLGVAWHFIQKLVAPGRLSPCTVRAKGLTLRHAETLAGPHAFTVSARGDVKVPLTLPELIARGELSSAGVHAQTFGAWSCALWFDARGAWLSMSGFYPTVDRPAETEHFYFSRVELMRSTGVWLEPAVPPVSHPLTVRSFALAEDAWPKVISAPALFEGFSTAVLTLTSRADTTLAVVRSLRLLGFEPHELSLDLEWNDWAALNAVSETLGGEFEAVWEDGPAVRHGRYGSIVVDELIVRMHWKRPELEVSLSSWRARDALQSFLEERLGCPVSRRRSASE